LHGAGKNWENAAQAARDLKDLAEAVTLYKKASSIYQENGHADKAAEVLSKASRALEDNPEQALPLLISAIDLYEMDEKDRYAGDAMRRATSLMLRHNKLEEALEMLQREVNLEERQGHINDLHKACVSIIIIHLARNDYVAADKAYNSFLLVQGFAGSPLARAAMGLLDAFEHSSPEALQACLAKQNFSLLDNQVVKLAKSLRVAGDYGQRSRPQESNSITLTSTSLSETDEDGLHNSQVPKEKGKEKVDTEDHPQQQGEEEEDEDSILL
jgi:tetratricopeptide (TPR) repeat protein